MFCPVSLWQSVSCLDSGFLFQCQQTIWSWWRRKTEKNCTAFIITKGRRGLNLFWNIRDLCWWVQHLTFILIWNNHTHWNASSEILYIMGVLVFYLFWMCQSMRFFRFFVSLVCFVLQLNVVPVSEVWIWEDWTSVHEIKRDFTAPEEKLADLKGSEMCLHVPVRLTTVPTGGSQHAYDKPTRSFTTRFEIHFFMNHDERRLKSLHVLIQHIQ